MNRSTLNNTTLNNKSTVEHQSTQGTVAYKKAEVLFENIHLYKFPHCSMDPAHQHYQLNELCLEPGCKESFIPQCVQCIFDTHKTKKGHQTKPLKMIFNELAAQLESLFYEFESYSNRKDEIEMTLEDIDKELKNLEELSRQMQEHISFYLDRYRKTMRKEPFERIACRRVLKEIFKSDTEDILREKMLELANFVIIEDETLKVNDRASIEKWDQSVKHAKGYILDIKEPLDRMVELRAHLEKTLRQYAMGEDDAESDGDRSEAGWEPNNIADYSKSKFEQKMQQKDNKKSELEKRKEGLKKTMEEHIEECDNKHCSFIDIPYKIKWWKTLWFKQNTDCNEGKRLNLEMETILNEIRHIEKLRWKK